MSYHAAGLGALVDVTAGSYQLSQLQERLVSDGLITRAQQNDLGAVANATVLLGRRMGYTVKTATWDGSRLKVEESLLARLGERPAERVPPPSPVTLPPVPGEERPAELPAAPPSRRRISPLMIAGGVGLVLVIGSAVYFATRKKKPAAAPIANRRRRRYARAA